MAFIIFNVEILLTKEVKAAIHMPVATVYRRLILLAPGSLAVAKLACCMPAPCIVHLIVIVYIYAYWHACILLSCSLLLLARPLLVRLTGMCIVTFRNNFISQKKKKMVIKSALFLYIYVIQHLLHLSTDFNFFLTSEMAVNKHYYE